MSLPVVNVADIAFSEVGNIYLEKKFIQEVPSTIATHMISKARVQWHIFTGLKHKIDGSYNVSNKNKIKTDAEEINTFALDIVSIKTTTTWAVHDRMTSQLLNKSLY